MREQARLTGGFQPVFASRLDRGELDATSIFRLPASSSGAVRSLGLGLAGLVAVVAIGLAAMLVAVRLTYVERIYPAVSVADVPIGGLPFDAARAAVADRAQEIEASQISLSFGDRTWTASLANIGVAIDPDDAVARAAAVGREPMALRRLRSVATLSGSGERVALPLTLDHGRLDQWFDAIDRELGAPPRNASIAVDGTTISIIPEVDGTVVDRERARAVIAEELQNMGSIAGELPVVTKIATVRAADLEPARELLLRAMSHPVQVTNGAGLWTLPAAELAQFLRQDVRQVQGDGRAIELGLDRERLAFWLEERLGGAIDTEPVNAEVGWNGERLVSAVPSVDGVRLDAAKLAELVESQFFGAGGTVDVPVTYVKPEIDSANLDKLGITTLLGSGSSNYAGSSDGRAHNVAVGGQLINGTLIPPWGEFSFNDAIGLIDEEKGFVEAQVIAGERIGKDIGGGICQVSTTVFRAAYLAGLPITEWWPHRFRIGFYEYDDWDPGLDASILQPTDDPETWADFRFENPSASWMLVESWTDGERVVVNIYGADLGYQVESTGPTWGDKAQLLLPQEVVDDELDPGTVTLAQVAGIGEELSHYRVVRDRNGELLWERSFYTKYFPRGDIWKVSPDMKGQAPIDKEFQLPPLPPSGIDSVGWIPDEEALAAAEAWKPPVEEWIPPPEDSAETWTPPAEDSAEAWTPPAEPWAPPAEEPVAGSEEWIPPAEDVPAA